MDNEKKNEITYDMKDLEIDMFINNDEKQTEDIVKKQSQLKQFVFDLNLKNYKRRFDKKHKKLIKDYNEKKKEAIEINKKLNKLAKVRKNKFFELQNELNPDKSMNFYLIPHEDKDLFKDEGNDKGFKKWFKKDMTGYITYFNKTNNMKIFEVSNLRNIYNIKNLESYAIHKYIGSYNKKPNFLIKYPIPISLEFIKTKKSENEGHELVFDTESFYTYIEKIDTYKLTKPKGSEDNGFLAFIGKYIFIIIGVGVILFLLLTNQGKILLGEIIKAFSLKPK